MCPLFTIVTALFRKFISHRDLQLAFSTKSYYYMWFRVINSWCWYNFPIFKSLRTDNKFMRVINFCTESIRNFFVCWEKNYRRIWTSNPIFMLYNSSVTSCICHLTPKLQNFFIKLIFNQFRAYLFKENVTLSICIK